MQSYSKNWHERRATNERKKLTAIRNPLDVLRKTAQNAARLLRTTGLITSAESATYSVLVGNVDIARSSKQKNRDTIPDEGS